jgi:bifunctional NMN adenylyltransferase/nudix hydrolase
MEVKTPAGDIGVIIGRFQVPDLHDGHRDLIDTVKSRHKRVLMFLCSTPGVLVTRKNPLDYFTRMMMVQGDYPDMVVLPLHDMQNDSDWSSMVDKKIAETFGNHVTAVLYGSRDAFIPYYDGRHPTVELAESVDISGTAVREAASNEVRQHSEFRRGVVYAAHNKHPATFPTVDIAVIKYNETEEDNGAPPHKIALGRKFIDPIEQWRLPGGFIDPNKDQTFEAAAKRELREEMGINLNIDKLVFVGSHKVNDWRYRNELDQIITTVFTTRYLWGPLAPGDDIDEAKWFDLDNFNPEILVEEHRPLMKMVLAYLEKEQNNGTI